MRYGILFTLLACMIGATLGYDVTHQAPKANQPNPALVQYYYSKEKEGSKRDVFDIPRQSYGTIRCLQLICTKFNVTFETLSIAYYAVDCGGRGYVFGFDWDDTATDTFAEVAALFNFTVCTESCTTTGINATVDPYLVTLMGNHSETCDGLSADPTYYTLSDDCGINTLGSSQQCYSSDGTTPTGAPACNQTDSCEPASIVPDTCWYYVCYADTDLGAIVGDCAGNTFLYWWNNDTNIADDMLQRYGLLPCEWLVYCDNSSLVNKTSAPAGQGITPYNNNGTWSTFGWKMCNSNGVILPQVGTWTFNTAAGVPYLTFPLVEQCGCTPQVNGSEAPSAPPLSMTTLNEPAIGPDDPRDDAALGIIAGVIGACCCCWLLLILFYLIFTRRNNKRKE